MEKILLLNPPGSKLYQRDMYCSAVSKAHYYWPAIDLLVLSGTLSPFYEIEIIDAIVTRMDHQDCLKRIQKGEYKAVIFLSGTASWKEDFTFLAQIKDQSPQTLLIGNGDILLYNAEDFLNRYDFLDAVLLDYTSDDIVKFLREETQAISAMAFRRNGRIEVRKKAVTAEEFSYPVPQHEKFPLRKYLLAQGKRYPFTTVQTTFGCPFRCSFCVASTLGFKYRSVDNVMEELRYVAGLGIKDIFFTDFTFEAHRKNTLEICRRIIAENLDLSWVCSSRASTLDRELLELMKRAGCHTVMLGVESGDDDLLVRYSKGVNKEQLRNIFALCRKLRIRTLGHFIIGLPGETEETARKTITFARELRCDIASFNIAMPALGTPLRETALQNGWLPEAQLEFDASDSYPVMETPEFSKEQAWKWRKKAVRSFYFRPSYLLKAALSARSFYQWKILVLNALALFKRY